MRDLKRIDRILAKLSMLWHKHPDMRLGQLIGNIISFDKRRLNPFYLEDGRWEAAIDEFLERNND